MSTRPNIFLISSRAYGFHFMNAPISNMKYIFIVLFSLLLYSCCDEDEEPDAVSNPSIVMHNSNGIISFSYLDQVPPREVSHSNVLFTFAAPWAYRALSISPGGRYGAIAMFSQAGTARAWEGKIMVYNTSDGSLFKEYNKTAFISLMNFPVADASMLVERLGWMNNDQLLVHLQPQTPWIESIPQNASLIINVISDTRVDLKYSNRSDPFTIQAPEHSSRNRYSSEIRQSKLYINGTMVSNLPDISTYDVYFNEDL